MLILAQEDRPTFFSYSAMAPRLGFIWAHCASSRALFLVRTLGSAMASRSAALSLGSSSAGLSPMACRASLEACGRATDEEEVRGAEGDRRVHLSRSP